MDARTGLRKRQQISRANRMMFLWIAGVSVIVGFSLVLMLFLVQKIWFGERVLAEKMKTVSVLEKNIAVAPALKDNVRVLNTNADLQSTKLNDDDPAIQSILDALPADANSAAMASSLQTKLLSGVSNVAIDSLRVDPVSGVETTEGDSSEESEPGTIGFSFIVSTNANNREALQQILVRIERSIRPFTITTVSLESQGNRFVMSVTGRGYYEPARSLALSEKVVKP